MIPSVLNGTVDFVVSTLSATAERATVVDFSKPGFYSAGATLYTSPDQAAIIGDWEGARGRTICIANGYYATAVRGHSQHRGYTCHRLTARQSTRGRASDHHPPLCSMRPHCTSPPPPPPTPSQDLVATYGIVPLTVVDFAAGISAAKVRCCGGCGGPAELPLSGSRLLHSCLTPPCPSPPPGSCRLAPARALLPTAASPLPSPTASCRSAAAQEGPADAVLPHAHQCLAVACLPPHRQRCSTHAAPRRLPLVQVPGAQPFLTTACERPLPCMLRVGCPCAPVACVLPWCRHAAPVAAAACKLCL